MAAAFTAAYTFLAVNSTRNILKFMKFHISSF